MLVCVQPEGLLRPARRASATLSIQSFLIFFRCTSAGHSNSGLGADFSVPACARFVNPQVLPLPRSPRSHLSLAPACSRVAGGRAAHIGACAMGNQSSRDRGAHTWGKRRSVAATDVARPRRKRRGRDRQSKLLHQAVELITVGDDSALRTTLSELGRAGISIGDVHPVRAMGRKTQWID